MRRRVLRADATIVACPLGAGLFSYWYNVAEALCNRSLTVAARKLLCRQRYA